MLISIKKAGFFLIPLALTALTLPAALAASELNGDDSDFVKKVAKSNNAEVELARLAEKKADSREVKEFANQMIRDHSKANRELGELAASKGMDMPKGTPLSEDVSAVHLKMLSGKSFDEAYVKAMVDDHKDAVAMFEKTADSAQDSDVKHFASKMLPTLREHLTRIEQINANINPGK
jgi:putative membrane protein